MGILDIPRARVPAAPTRGEISIVADGTLSRLSRPDTTDCLVRARRILDAGANVNRKQLAVLRDLAELLEAADATSAAVEVRVDIPREAAPALDFLLGQAHLRRMLPVRLMRTCCTCGCQTVVNPELERALAKREGAAKAVGVVSGLGSFALTGGVSTLMSCGLRALSPNAKRIEFTCQRCRGLEYHDVEATLCPDCHTPTTAPVLSTCAHCGYVYADRVSNGAGWTPTASFELPPASLVRVATQPLPARVTGVAYGNELVVFGCADGKARAYALREDMLEPLAVYEHQAIAPSAFTSFTRGRVSPPRLAVAVSPGDRLIAMGGPDGTVRIWDTASGSQLLALDHRLELGLSAAAPISGIAFLAGGTTLVTSTFDGRVKTWDLRTGEAVTSVRRTTTTYAVAAAGDVPAFAAGFGLLARSASVWHPLVGEVSLPHGSDVLAVTLTADGGRTVTAGRDGCARVWDVVCGRTNAVLAHGAKIVCVAVAPRSPLVATGSADNTARVWDLDTGRELARIPHASRIGGVAFSPDGSFLATGDAKAATIWALAHPGG